MLRIPSPQTFPPETLSLDKLIHNERNPVIFNEVCQRSESPLGFSPDIPARTEGVAKALLYQVSIPSTAPL
ncbi:hypothetical protein Phpb_01915 [Photorhabdus namnaonensis]|uniref:Uncharacterized protein n=1 Tax=Photorhabdus namnaonensis TaxID=1851568 RepID=A0A1B8YIP1_9GAMM|nr:hypothetical protein Phpb_01915 [Photorhabdus namnaonensis]